MLVRIAISPDGEAVPDLAADLPGRGVWVSADRASVDQAVKRDAFSRSVKEKVRTDPGLSGRIEALLEARCLSLLGLARRGGGIAAGESKAREALKAQRPAWLIEASDGAADGRRKILALARAAWGDVPVAGCFTAAQLGAALGREDVVHAVLARGGLAGRFGAETARLAGFRALVPAEWGLSAGSGG
jgi:hypothetical protein